MTRIVLSLALFGLIPLDAPAAIRWQTTTVTSSFPAAALFDRLGAPLAADPGPGGGGTAGYDGLGFFVQLIWAGPNGIIDAVNTTTFVPGTSDGTEGTDDRVIDTSYTGRGRTGAPGASTNPHGHIVNQTAPSEVAEGNGGGSTGQNYYIRAWNAPVAAGRLFDDSFFAPVVGGGLAPAAAATHYGNSTLFTTADPNDGNSEIFTAAGFSTLMPVVPEPATASLLGMGIVGVGLAINRRRQQS